MRALFLLPVLLLAACQTGGIDSNEATAEETRAVRLDNRELVLDGFAGDVSVTAVIGLQEAEVVFTKRAMGTTDRQAEARLEDIRIEEAGDGATYQFVWRTDADNPNVTVDAKVRVPLATNVVVRLGAGDITANGLRGTLDAETGAGEIRADHLRSARVVLSSSAGDIHAGAAFIPAEGRWSLESGAGDLLLLLPAAASVRVDAESRAGALDLDPALTFSDVRQSGGPAGVDFRAQLGEGQARIEAQTDAGNIEILQYKEPAAESEAARQTVLTPQDTLRRDSARASGVTPAP